MPQSEISHVAHVVATKKSPAEGIVRPRHMQALSGIRFFAIFNIFIFHLWIVHHIQLPAPLDLAFIDFARFPDIWQTYFSHGWMSTSFFFLLSGFMLGYLYWGDDGNITMNPKRFLVLRLSRIYPIHALVLTTIFCATLFGFFDKSEHPLYLLILSGISTLFLVQGWVPQLVPVWSWPAWNLSAIVFLYLITPWLMRTLAKLSIKQMKILLGLLPFISLIPTTIFAFMTTKGFEWTQNYNIFLSSNPLFWVPHFVAGMLLTKVFSLSRAHPPSEENRRWLSFGDICMVAALILAFSDWLDTFDERNFFRHGVMMPLYLIVILDLARGHGVVSRFFSLPGMNFLGETGFSIFVWQSLLMLVCVNLLFAFPALALNQLWFVCGGIVVLAIFSTYCIEKPLQRKIRRWLLLK